MFGIIVALCGLGSLYGHLESGWHWMFHGIGILLIFVGGVLCAMPNERSKVRWFTSMSTRNIA